MSFCIKCGHKTENVKFCPNCGAKIDENKKNKIDNSVNIVKKNVDLVSNEIKESQVLNTLKTKTLPRLLNRIIDVLGIIGLITIIGQILISIVKKEPFHFQEAYHRYQNSSFEYFFSGFLAEILFTTILPFVFMFWSGIRNRGLFLVSLLLFFVSLLVSNINDNRTSIESTNINTVVDSTAIDTINTFYENLTPDDNISTSSEEPSVNENLSENNDITSKYETEEIKKLRLLAKNEFKKYKLKYEPKGIVFDISEIYVEDLTNDGFLDVIIDYYGETGSTGNAHLGHEFAIFKNYNGTLLFYKSYNNDFLYKINNIENSKIYLIEREYTVDDPRCCPSIERKIELSNFENEIIKKEL